MYIYTYNMYLYIVQMQIVLHPAQRWLPWSLITWCAPQKLYNIHATHFNPLSQHISAQAVYKFIHTPYTLDGSDSHAQHGRTMDGILIMQNLLCILLMRAKSLKQLSRVCTFFLFGTAHTMYMYPLIDQATTLKGSMYMYICVLYENHSLLKNNQNQLTAKMIKEIRTIKRQEILHTVHYRKR